ncbi:MAG: isochorismatase family protein [Haliea sp.]|uniref:isochorismatase family protein n=1 Tax=Haliea sp. TaxID=1932666 RepID=UPI0032ED1457
MTLDALSSDNAALLVIDLQNAFCHPEGTLGRSGLDTRHLRSVIPPLRQLIEQCHAARLPVIWTLQEHFESDRRRSRKRLPAHTSKRKGISAIAGTWDAAVVDELADLVGDPTYVIRKHRFGGFYETRLHILLEQLGVDHLFITGLTTNACVETTVREAYLRDYDVIGVEDCIAGVNPEWEQAAQAVWRHYFGITCTTADFTAWLERERQPAAVEIGHVLLKVKDMAVSETFYLDLLGFTRKPDAKPLPDGRPLTVTQQGLGLTEGGSGSQEQMDHLAFRVRNVRALDEKARAAGVRFERELGPGPYGLTIYLRDPDDNIVELYEP